MASNAKPTQGNGGGSRKALLIPSKNVIFPFQTHISVISKEDGESFRKLGFQKAITSVEKKGLEEIPEDYLELIEKSKSKAVDLISKSSQSHKDKFE